MTYIYIYNEIFDLNVFTGFRKNIYDAPRFVFFLKLLSTFRVCTYTCNAGYLLVDLKRETAHALTNLRVVLYTIVCTYFRLLFSVFIRPYTTSFTARYINNIYIYTYHLLFRVDLSHLNISKAPQMISSFFPRRIVLCILRS